MRGRLQVVAASTCVAIPVVIALLGPLFASGDDTKGLASTPGQGGPFGTDFAGRDVLDQVLLGGRTVVLVAALATVCTYLVAVPLGMLAGSTGARLLDELLMRPLDLVLGVPSLLLILLIASIAPGRIEVLIGVVLLVNLPEVARISRAATLALAARPAVDAMRLQGETWWRISVGYLARGMRRTLLADLGTRFTGAIYLVASASFLGVGMPPQTSDWAAMVEANRGAMFVQPWAPAIPAALIVLLVIGINLLSERLLRTGKEPVR